MLDVSINNHPCGYYNMSIITATNYKHTYISNIIIVVTVVSYEQILFYWRKTCSKIKISM